MRFTTPLALLLLLSLPYFVWLGRPRSGVRRRDRHWASLGVRVLILLLLTLTLAGTQVVRAADELAVVFLVDASDSISQAQREAAEQHVREAIATMGPDDQAAVILFGANALVERPMSGLAELAPISSVPQPLHTDLAEAIRLGLALFPAGSARRLVVLSDGVQTIGDAQEAAQLAASAGVQIDYVPLLRDDAAREAWVTAVDAPTRVSEGETIVVNVTVESTANMPANLRVLAGGAVVAEQTVQLRSGANNFPIRLRAAEQEFVRYSVQLTPAEDVYYQNNELAAYTEIVGAPRVLLVAGGPAGDEGDPSVADESVQLRLALEGAGLTVDQVTPVGLPATLPQLSNYATIVLVDVNAKNLTSRKMAALQSFVRDLGGGLVAVGGPQSYGMGGYFRTPLEEALPVDMQIKDQDRFPSVSIVIVIDRSGSMSAPEGGLTKIQLADEAAVRVVELLNDFDEITVIPVDTEPDTVIGPASAADKGPIIEEIRQIGAGGGGINVRTGLEAATEALAESQNQVKHVIVLADGNDSNEQGGVPELIEALVSEGTTVSMVAIGDGKDVPWLQRMAELGEGRFHLTNEAANLPQIFTQETTAIQRSYLIEERFFPSLVSRSPILANINQAPPLYGYVGTSPKGTAQVILETHLGDPLLAAWQYGLGRTVAWTSDATGRWGRDWVQWSGFPTFWAQAVRWTITQGRDSNVEMIVSYGQERAQLTVDARAAGGAFLDDLQMEANVVAPDGAVIPVQLQQVAPGRYQAQFAPTAEGAYLIRVTGTQEGEGEALVAQTGGWVLGYSPEYRQLEANAALLETVAEMTDGRDLSGNPAAAFDHTLSGTPTTRPIWPWLTLLAVVLLPVDVALRRLVITRRDLQRAWAATFGRMRPQPIVERRSEQVARLFEAKQRAGTTPPSAGSALTPPPVSREAAAEEDTGVETEEKAPQSAPSPPQQPSEPASRAASTGSLASRLLERRRQSEGESEEQGE
ncbi:MAG: VWA domain-containing protein [Candidatus Promineifilaceae bacterium]|nr:VWA domain-containing protein [Candidatus Promineifilaceae bacterium]